LTYSIRKMYPYALLEGQGMGTAYEYYSKLAVMRRVFQVTRAPRSIVAMGLPEKHGYDLDFVLLAHELGTNWVLPCSYARTGWRSLQPYTKRLPNSRIQASRHRSRRRTCTA